MHQPYTNDQVLNGEAENITESQKEEISRYKKFKQCEYEVYKKLHRDILKDDGVPKLKKTTFRMPGYRQILSDAEIDEYSI